MVAAGRGQRGSAAFAVILALVGVIGLAAIAALTEAALDTAQREQQTALALAQARDALIGFAVASSGRPGDLPCPDLDNDGSADAVPGCSASSSRIGRLPWRTLDLPDLRDGNGERLWYAVSDNFKNNPRTACSIVGHSGCLNSDTRGTITVRGAAGAIMSDGSLAVAGQSGTTVARSGVIAVVFSPGPALKRVGAGASQDRSCTRGGGTDSACLSDEGRCTGTTPAEYIQTARCDPVNYLDIAGPPAFTVAGATGSAEDNATFADGVNTDGFISGTVRDGSGNVVVNDRLIAITYGDLVPLLEQRVVRQAFDCLSEYRSLNGGRLPYAADDDTLNFSEQYNREFGRIPDAPFTVSNTENPAQSTAWGATCALAGAPAWWMNWKDQVFYGFANNLEPDGSGSSCVPSSTCLTVNPPSAADNKNLVVLLAGRSLQSPAQTRGTGSNPISDFLEDANATVNSTYKQSATTSSFNDVVLFQ